MRIRKGRVLGGNRRDRTSIIRDILECAREGASVTHIIYATNLNHNICKSYLYFLMRRGLIREEIMDAGRIYVTSERGREFLYLYKKLEEIVQGEEISSNGLIR